MVAAVSPNAVSTRPSGVTTQPRVRPLASDGRLILSVLATFPTVVGRIRTIANGGTCGARPVGSLFMPAEGDNSSFMRTARTCVKDVCVPVFVGNSTCVGVTFGSVSKSDSPSASLATIFHKTASTSPAAHSRLKSNHPVLPAVSCSARHVREAQVPAVEAGGGGGRL